MLTARPVPGAAANAAGVGEVNAVKASVAVAAPNPNAGLNQFLVPDPAGGSAPVFDAASWNSIAGSDASWNSVSWNDASWNSAVLGDVNAEGGYDLTPPEETEIATDPELNPEGLLPSETDVTDSAPVP